MKKSKIIIIDDHNIFRNALKVFLEGTGAFTIVCSAENGKDGIEFIENNKVDLVILDIEMPVFNGTQTLAYLKEKFPKLPVLVLSFYKNNQLHYNIFCKGAAGVLCKTVDLKVLTLAIEKILKEGIYVSDEIGLLMIDSQKNKKNELTKKELLMLDLLMKEVKIDTIAEKLHLTKRSAENLRIKIKEKVGVKTSYGLVQYAIANGVKYYTVN